MATPRSPEAYRRWVCSSLLPLFVSGAALGARGGRVPGEDSPARDGRPPAPPPRKRSTSRDNYKLYASNNKNTKLKNDYLNYELGDKDASGADYFETLYYSASRNVSRSGLRNASAGPLWGEGFVTGRPWNEKGHGRPEHRVVGTKKDLDNRLGARRRRATTTASAALNFRVKPCLAVCQRVEQACPYFLPGDRAPSYPTQYAGEPTFLCLDPNIEETGEQLRKSNYGDTDCCYTHCGPSGEELCSRCHHGATLPAQDQPHSAPCGSQVPAQAPSTQCGSQTIVSPAQTSSTRRTTPDPVVIIIFAWFPFLYSAYNNIVLSPRRKDARYSLTFIVLSRIMRIVWCTRL